MEYMIVSRWAGSCAAITQLGNLPLATSLAGHLRDDSGNETTFAAKPRGNAWRNVTPAIVGSVSSVIVGGAISSVRNSASMISLESEPNRSHVLKSGLLHIPRQIVNLRSSRRCEPHSGVSVW